MTHVSQHETVSGPPPTPLLLSVRDVAERLSVSVWTVYDLCQTGHLESRKIGSRRLITPEALRAYVDGLPVEEPEATA